MNIFGYYPENLSEQDKELEKKIFLHSLIFASFFVGILWLVKIVEEVFGLNFVHAGIFPLTVKGLPGIVTSQFIHSSFNHLISNSVSYFILLFTLVYYYRRFSYRIFFQLSLLSGFCVWLGGRDAWHIGASGVVYGLATFHFVSGVIRNDLRLLTISAVVVFLYGGMLWGMLPIKPEISWESHLWGAASGVILAVYYRKYSIQRKKFDWEEEPEVEEETEDINPTDTTKPPTFDYSGNTFSNIDGDTEPFK